MKKLYEKLKKLRDITLTWISLHLISPVHWNGLAALFNHGRYWRLTEADHDHIRLALIQSYYIVLNRRKTHLTTYLIALANLIKTGSTGHYTHAFMNADDGTSNKNLDFKLIEATGSGVHYSTFMQVFDCDSVCLLRPKGFTKQEWTLAIDACLSQLGKEYDCLFDYQNDTKLSCIELVRTALMGLPEYTTRFAAFEKMIADTGNVTPQMLYDCPDFEVIWEQRR